MVLLRGVSSLHNKGMKILKGIACPKFQGNREPFKKWRENVAGWLLLEKEKVKFPGLVIKLWLRKKAFEIIKSINNEKFMKKMVKIYLRN